MDKFQNKYRIPSARLQTWDYGSNGAYFITICTKNREHFFGEIIDKQFIASEIGKLAQKYWEEIPTIFPFVELGNFVVMPNHTHGILIIDKNANLKNNKTMDMDAINNTINDVINETINIAINVETRLIASLPPPQSLPPLQSFSPPPSTQSLPPPPQSYQPIHPPSNTINGGFAGNKNPMFHENISRIIRWYKGRCTFEMRKIHSDFAWQPSFHDHIIRNEQSFERIQTYIADNPINWKEDRFYENEK